MPACEGKTKKKEVSQEARVAVSREGVVHFRRKRLRKDRTPIAGEDYSYTMLECYNLLCEGGSS